MRKKLVTSVLALGVVFSAVPKGASAQVTDTASAEIRVTIDTAIEMRIRTVSQNGVALAGDDFDSVTYSANQDEIPATSDSSIYTDEEVLDHGGDAVRMLIAPRNFSTMSDEIRILTNSTSGFRLDAMDGFAGYALEKTDTDSGTGASPTDWQISDWSGSLASPSAMTDTSSHFGFGLTVVSVSTDGLDDKWSAGDNYAGLGANYSATAGDELYIRDDYDAVGNGETVVTTRYKMNVPITQMAGDYDGVVNYQVVTL